MESSEPQSCSIPPLPGWPKVIGGVEVDNPIWLAPLAGITFSSFRRLHRSLGAALVHTEMVSALGLKHKGVKTKELLYGSECEAPCVLQLFGSNADDIACGAEIALGIRNFAALEINMACPMPKVTKRGCGSKLLENPKEAAGMVRALKRLALPVWIKTRIMPQGSPLTTADFCGELFAAGADFIFVHGRTPAQRYEGVASREIVANVARRFPGFVGGSGDCYSPGDFIEYLNIGCSAVLAARGVLRDALLIPRTLKALGCEVPEAFCNPAPDTQAKILLELGDNIYNTEGESSAMAIARRMLGSLFKGFHGVSQLRRAGALVRSWPEMASLLREWRENLRTGAEIEIKGE